MIVIALGLAVGGCRQEVSTVPPVKLTIGVETSLLPATVWIAENKGYFFEEGLDLKIVEFNSGKTALSTMLKDGGLDMATAAQTPIVFNSFERDDYVVIAAMVYSDDDVNLIARLDAGVKDPSDIKGKKIGVTKGSTGHFFLGLFLTLNNIKISEVEIIDLEPQDLPRALADGRVDAISSWEPHIVNAAQLLGDNARILPSENIFREEFYFIVKRNFAEENHETLKRFLRAASRASDFIRQNQEESQAIVAERLRLDKDIVSALWDKFVFEVSLNQSLLVTLDDEAKWAIRNNLTDKRDLPNYFEFIYMDALHEVRPDAVTIIH